jgi:hypothetical protein
MLFNNYETLPTQLVTIDQTISMQSFNIQRSASKKNGDQTISLVSTLKQSINSQLSDLPTLPIRNPYRAIK